MRPTLDQIMYGFIAIVFTWVVFLCSIILLCSCTSLQDFAHSRKTCTIGTCIGLLCYGATIDLQIPLHYIPPLPSTVPSLVVLCSLPSFFVLNCPHTLLAHCGLSCFGRGHPNQAMHFAYYLPSCRILTLSTLILFLPPCRIMHDVNRSQS